MDTDIGWTAIVALLALVGLWALLLPGSLLSASRRTARLIRLPYGRWMDKTLYVDRVIYRCHRSAGLAIWSVSCGILGLTVFGRGYPPDSAAVGNWGFEALVSVLFVAGVVGFCGGLVVMLRPSAIKPLEAWGNRWVKLPESALDRDIRHLPLERWVDGHTRLFGGAVLLSDLAIGILVF